MPTLPRTCLAVGHYNGRVERMQTQTGAPCLKFAWATRLGVGLKVDFVLDGGLLPAGAKQNASAGFDHTGMAAQVDSGIVGAKVP